MCVNVSSTSHVIEIWMLLHRSLDNYNQGNCYKPNQGMLPSSAIILITSTVDYVTLVSRYGNDVPMIMMVETARSRL